MRLMQLSHVGVNFAGRELYRGLTWEIKAQERVALVGPNGAGKSTLFKLLLGEIQPGQRADHASAGHPHRLPAPGYRSAARHVPAGYRPAKAARAGAG